MQGISDKWSERFHIAKAGCVGIVDWFVEYLIKCIPNEVFPPWTKIGLHQPCLVLGKAGLIICWSRRVCC